MTHAFAGHSEQEVGEPLVRREGDLTFIATARFSAESLTSKTAPLPPRASSRTTL